MSAPRLQATRSEKLGLAASATALLCAGASELGSRLWNWDWMCADRSRPPLAALFFLGAGALVFALGLGLRIVLQRPSRVGVVAVAAPILLVLALVFVKDFGFPGARVLPIFPMRNEDCGGDPMRDDDFPRRPPRHYLTPETMKDFGQHNTY